MIGGGAEKGGKKKVPFGAKFTRCNVHYVVSYSYCAYFSFHIRILQNTWYRPVLLFVVLLFVDGLIATYMLCLIY